MTCDFHRIFCRQISSMFLFGGETDAPIVLCRNALQERNDAHLRKRPGYSSTLHRHALLVSRNVIIREFTVGHL